MFSIKKIPFFAKRDFQLEGLRRRISCGELRHGDDHLENFSFARSQSVRCEIACEAGCGLRGRCGEYGF